MARNLTLIVALADFMVSCTRLMGIQAEGIQVGTKDCWDC